MSADTSSGPCEKFQANVFNHSKCQNCFKSRELHLLGDPLVEQGKTVYGGWLCLAPEGSDFGNPTLRPRKWRRRFFLLHEHGSLTYALDELPGTLPQGTVNMSLCTDILDAETRTGHRNTLCIITAEQEVFVRADSKDVINGWSEQLLVYLSSSRQKPKKKRKVEAVSGQEPTPAKMAATCPAMTTATVLTDAPLGEEPPAETTPVRTEEDRDPPKQDLSDPRPPEREPDLLNFKKGWMVKQCQDAQWRKYWCVLSADNLRFYKHSKAEEASEQEGEVDLSKCVNVCECDVQKNYGIQIHTPAGVCTLSAMTAGIRRNWIQALMKNMHTASDVTSQPDVTRDSSERDRRTRTVLERRRDGRYKTCDWTELKPLSKPPADADLHSGETPPSLQSGDLEQSHRKEVRRRRYENILGVSPGREVMGDAATANPRTLLEEEMEACWKQVEKTTFRHLTDHAHLIIMDDYKKFELEDSERSRSECQCQPSVSCQLEPQHERVGDEGPLSGCAGSTSPETPPTRCIRDADRDSLPVCLSSAASDRGGARCAPHVFTSEHRVCLLRPQASAGCAMLDTLAEAGGDSVEGLARVSQEVELLTRRNRALDQRNQEMLNQLMEADVHIERLKEELRRTDPKKTQGLERELLAKNQKLLEAQTLITSLEDSLRDAQRGGAQEERLRNTESYLLRCFEATEAKLSELEEKLRQSQLSCRKLQAENATLKEAQNLCLQRDARMLSREAEGTMALRWNLLEKLLEDVARFYLGKTWMWTSSEEEGQAVATACQRKWCPEAQQEAELLGGATSQMIPEENITKDESRLGGGKRGQENPLEQLCEQSVVERSGRVAHMITPSPARAQDEVGLMAERLFRVAKPPWSALFYLAATQAAYCCHVTRLCSAYQWETPGSAHPCNRCLRLMEENRRLGERLCSAERRAAKVTPQHQVIILAARVAELEEQLSITSQNLTSAQRQHDKDMEKQKAACERSLAAMEESHLKVSEELQRRHLQEVDRLLEDTDRLLEEETAATATAMEAIERAHRLELDKEVQRRRRVIGATGGALVEHMHKQHSEDLASSQRELEDLSCEFSRKCLENNHLLQVLDAERKALSQRQQENRDLMALNQELSAQLTSNITRRSPAEREALAPAHDVIVSKLELLLRVKEYELTSVRQQLSSLRQKLHATQRVKGDPPTAQEVPG
ncbi:uncharacterized protein [Nerophis lumbriciformis]|uniref:uncharacterized protein n=1 Tax=Nerophis lumbriciformis TaxID=546530 RepID=UPI002AE061EE|nr:myosin phosphatase Rho-interacting protein-like [Nerophis lumbriciformis]